MLTGAVPGRLTSWIRAVDGRRIGSVDFSISDSRGGNVTRATDADGRDRSIATMQTFKRAGARYVDQLCPVD
jgi:hypothetical protein